jgi:hypothetical protein
MQPNKSASIYISHITRNISAEKLLYKILVVTQNNYEVQAIPPSSNKRMDQQDVI